MCVWLIQTHRVRICAENNVFFFHKWIVFAIIALLAVSVVRLVYCIKAGWKIAKFDPVYFGHG